MAESAKKVTYYHWLNIPPEQRFPSTKAEWARMNNVTHATLNNWDKGFTEWKKLQGSNGSVAKLEGLDGESVVQQFVKLMGQLALDPTRPAKDRELFAKMAGLLIDRSEQKVTLELTGDDYANIEREARRRNLEEGYSIGEGKMQGQPDLLPQEIRKNP
jgi:hypothetical protein